MKLRVQGQRRTRERRRAAGGGTRCQVAYDRYVGESSSTSFQHLRPLPGQPRSRSRRTTARRWASCSLLRYGHAEGLTDEQIHVPLIVKLPQGRPARTSSSRARSRSSSRRSTSMPTMLRGDRAPPLPGQRGKALSSRTTRSTWRRRGRPEARRTRSRCATSAKLIYFPAEERFAMYDLATDPGELTDVFAERRASARASPNACTHCGCRARGARARRVRPTRRSATKC